MGVLRTTCILFATRSMTPNLKVKSLKKTRQPSPRSSTKPLNGWTRTRLPTKMTLNPSAKKSKLLLTHFCKRCMPVQLVVPVVPLEGCREECLVVSAAGLRLLVELVVFGGGAPAGADDV